MTYDRWYNEISRPFRSARASRAVRLVDKGLVYAFVAAFAITACALLLRGDDRIVKALGVPAVTFALVTVIRSLVNRKRPYETFAIEPIIGKETAGKSLPSRHAASAVSIAVMLLWLNPGIGAAALACALIVCFTRIVGGVHYPSDVAAAVALAVICAAIGYLTLPA